MYDYVELVLGEANPLHVKGTNGTTPAGSNIFKTDDEAEKLSEEETDQFHRNVAKLLFLSKRERPDLQTTVVFLCTQVQYPDVNNAK